MFVVVAGVDAATQLLLLSLVLFDTSVNAVCGITISWDTASVEDDEFNH